MPVNRRSQEWQQANKERAAASNKAYRLKHKDRLKAIKDLYQSTPEYKAYAVEKSRIRRQNGKQKAVDHFGNKCHDCQQSFPNCVYDFHHLDPEEKEFTPGFLMGNRWEVILGELEKCIMLCSNCHRIRHKREYD